MKLLKIGSSPACDIVINSEYVSSLHAEMTLLDNGDIILVDKGSTNGTFVGTKRINPNQDVNVRRGDYIRFGNEDLVWARIPALERMDNYKTIVNIGSNFRNDIIINNEAVSRFHATLRIDKSGRVFIFDNNSKNGTQVNGVRLQPGKGQRIKRGDNVICGMEDITYQLEQYIPSAFPMWARIASAVVGVAALVAIIFALMPDIHNDKMTVDKARLAVVYVRASFHYEVTIDDEPFVKQEYNALLRKRTVGIPYQATAFFIDKEGHMATNRHVAMPWAEEYRQEGVTQELREEYQKFLLQQLNVNDWAFFLFPVDRVLGTLQTTELGRAILASSSNVAEVLAKIKTIQNSKIVITGELDDITVGYAGQYYTHEDQFQRCFVVVSSKTKENDVAILQLSNKKTPAEIETVFDLNTIPEEDIQPQKEVLYVVGYPHGINWAQDKQSKSLEPNAKETKCSKVSGKNHFEFQESSVGGSSGSPVFTKDDGKLVGILSSGYASQTISFAEHAKFLKKLYEDEVGPIKK